MVTIEKGDRVNNRSADVTLLSYFSIAVPSDIIF